MATTLRPGQVLVISHRGVPSNLVGWLHIKIDRGTVWVVIPNHRGLKLLWSTPPTPAEDYTILYYHMNGQKHHKSLQSNVMCSAASQIQISFCSCQEWLVWMPCWGPVRVNYSNWSKVWTIRKCGMWHYLLVHRQTFVNLEIDTKRGSVMTRWR